MIELTFFGRVDEEGRLKIADRKGFDSYLLNFCGQPVTVDIKKKKAKRSNQQNAFFHSWITLLAEHTGYTKEEMKEIVKFKFLKVEEIHDQTGETFIYTKSTAKLNKGEFSDLCTEVQNWARDTFEILLPLPGNNWEITFTT